MVYKRDYYQVGQNFFLPSWVFCPSKNYHGEKGVNFKKGKKTYASWCGVSRIDWRHGRTPLGRWVGVVGLLLGGLRVGRGRHEPPWLVGLPGVGGRRSTHLLFVRLLHLLVGFLFSDWLSAMWVRFFGFILFKGRENTAFQFWIWVKNRKTSCDS